GSYRVIVRRSGELGGDYTLRVGGATGAAAPFVVTATSPADGALLASYPTTYRIDFSQPLLLPSVQPGDLAVNGVPADAVSVVDADTLEFTITGANSGDGLYTVTLPAGALTSLAGMPLVAFTATFDSDATSPRVVTSSVGE